MDVLVYSTPTCPYCRMVKELLKQKGVPFREQDITRDPAAASEMVRRTGQQSVPVTIIDGEVVMGFDRARLEQLLARKAGATRPRFGASVADASAMAARRGSPLLPGAYVGGVRPGSPAARAGLDKDDIIVEVNQQPVRSAADLERVVAGLNPGGRLVVTFVRQGQTRKVESSI